jgi:mercuric ion binding protein
MMKKMKSFATLFLLSVLASEVWAAAEAVDVTVDGMVCSFCAQGITKKFKAQSAVETVKVVLSDQKVYLTLKDGQLLSDEAITSILKAAGYKVEKVERKPV